MLAGKLVELEIKRHKRDLDSKETNKTKETTQILEQLMSNTLTAPEITACNVYT